MMVDDDFDHERENRISQEYYQKGYFEGSTKATSDIVNYLINLSDEKLIEWKKQKLALYNGIDAIINFFSQQNNGN